MRVVLRLLLQEVDQLRLVWLPGSATMPQNQIALSSHPEGGSHVLRLDDEPGNFQHFGYALIVQHGEPEMYGQGLAVTELSPGLVMAQHQGEGSVS